MKILLVDDHKMVRDSLALYLTQLDQDIEIRLAANIDEGLAAFASMPEGFDVVLLDLHLPGVTGFEGLEAIQKSHPKLPVVIFSGDATRSEAIESVKRGAAGFISKTSGGAALLRALNVILSGERFVPSSIIPDSEFESLLPLPVPHERASPLDGLTRREKEVLSYLVDGCATAEIADTLGLKPITVSFHLRQIFEKLGASNRTQAAAIALRLGWDDRRQVV